MQAVFRPRKCCIAAVMPQIISMHVLSLCQLCSYSGGSPKKHASPVRWPATIPSSLNKILFEAFRDGVVPKQVLAAIPVPKRAIKNVHGGVILHVLCIMQVAQEVLQLQSDCIPIVISLNLQHNAASERLFKHKAVYFASETSSLHWKSKLINAWGQ